MSEADAFDVVIFGGGPAGAATAVFLAQSGLSVSIQTRTRREVRRFGESLSPQSDIVLKQLGIWETFLADGHSPCHGNKSIWGSHELTLEDFIRHPYGHAWHIDRPRFESRLLERAIASGVRIFQEEQSPQVSHKKGFWSLHFQSPARSIRARFLVDATGRAHWLARSQGAQYLFEDRQVALVAFFRTSASRLRDSTNLIEATSTGWWYSAVLPDGDLAVTFMTDPDLHTTSEIMTRTGLMKLVDEAPLTKARIFDCDYQLAARPRLVSANSGRIDTISGTSWLAVGDAALSLDPLASHGLTIAMTTGRDAADVIIRYLAGDFSAPSYYTSFIADVYRHYRSVRALYYLLEKRWREAPYWARRRALTMKHLTEHSAYYS